MMRRIGGRTWLSLYVVGEVVTRGQPQARRERINAERRYDFAGSRRRFAVDRSPADWRRISEVAADSGRTTWDAWDNVRTGEGRLERQRSSAE
jgi:hypothetical protein